MRLILIFYFLSFPLYSFDHTHSQFNKILKEHVIFEGPQSLLNYEKIRTKPASLDNYLTQLSSVKKETFDSWTRNQRLVFLINSYNAFTIKMIIKNKPVESIKDIGNIFKSTWKRKFISLFNEEIHLDHIEHELIRAKFDEPRIHFALVCASISCPPLLNEAFTAKKIEQQFEKAIVIFLKDKSKNYYDNKKNIIYASKIFKWYGEDFKYKYGNFKSFISPYLSEDKNIKTATVRFLSYNWKLNTQ